VHVLSQTSPLGRLNVGSPSAGMTLPKFTLRLLSCAFFVCCCYNLWDFEIWASVYEWIGADPYEYLEMPLGEIFSHPWGIRTGLVIPCLLYSQLTGTTIEASFAATAGGCVLYTVWCINRTAVDCFGTDPRRHAMLVLLAYMAISYPMNGRICYAFVGSATLMYAHLHWFRRQLSTRRVVLLNIIGLMFATTSSGAFIVALGTVAVWLFFATFDLYADRLRAGFCPSRVLMMLPVLAGSTYQLTLLNEKLNRWHDGDYMMILYHGPGAILEELLPFIDPFLLIAGVMAVIGIAIAGWLFLVQRFPSVNVYMLTVIALSIAMGVCGWSTLATNLPTGTLFVVAFVFGRRPWLAPATPVIPTPVLLRSAAPVRRRLR